MKKEIAPPVLIGIIVAVVLLLGFIGYRMFSPSDAGGSSQNLQAAKAAKNKRDGGD